MYTVDDVMQKVCRYAAEAVRRYVDISGTTPGDMPEYFMNSYVFDKLGSEITLTLETGTTELKSWDADTKARRSSKADVSNLVALKAAVQRLDRSGRIDLVAFDGQSQAKDEEGMLALIEFKRWHLSREDRNKLADVLRYLETCQSGAICSLLHVNDALLAWKKEEQADAARCGDHWIECRVDVPGNYIVCACTFARDRVINEQRDRRQPAH